MVRQRTPKAVATTTTTTGGSSRKARLIKAKYGEGGNNSRGKGGVTEQEQEVVEESKEHTRQQRRRSGLRDCCVMMLAFLAPVTLLEFYRADDSTIGLWNKFLDILKIPEEHNNNNKAGAAADVSSLSSATGALAKLVSSSVSLMTGDSTSMAVKNTEISNTANAAANIAAAVANDVINNNNNDNEASSSPEVGQLTITLSPNTKKVHIPRQQTVAYLVPFFKSCGRLTTMRDAATVLRQSIHMQSGQNSNANLDGTDKYGYQMYALVLRETCTREIMDVLETLGYKVFEIDSPVKLDQIQNDFVKQNLGKGNTDGGIGSYIQLLAHQLVEEPIFVILYINTMLLKPLDDLFTAIQFDSDTPEGQQARLNLVSKGIDSTTTTTPLPNQIHHFFVRDYPNTAYGRKPVTHTPGFLVARKNPALIQQAVDLIHQGNYTEGLGTTAGWGGLGYTMYFVTGLTMPGFYSYFLDTYHAATSVELDGCLYNHNGMDNKFRKPPRFNAGDGKNIGKCRSGATTCSDCMNTDINSISTILYDVTCFEPWKCYGEAQEGGTQRKKINTEITTLEHCLTIQKEWHNLRKQIETTIASSTTIKNVDVASAQMGHYHEDFFAGHCHSHMAYIPMPFTRAIDQQIAEVLWGGK